MKIRSGFVSNSSSSSFIALGFSIEANPESYKDLLVAAGTTTEEIDKILKENKEYCEKHGYRQDEYEALHELVYDLGRDQGVHLLRGGEDGVREDDNVIALMLAETDDYNGGCFDRGEIICDESNEDYRKVSKLKDNLKIDAPIRILYGTRCC